MRHTLHIGQGGCEGQRSRPLLWVLEGRSLPEWPAPLLVRPAECALAAVVDPEDSCPVDGFRSPLALLCKMQHYRSRFILNFLTNHWNRFKYNINPSKISPNLFFHFFDSFASGGLTELFNFVLFHFNKTAQKINILRKRACSDVFSITHIERIDTDVLMEGEKQRHVAEIVQKRYLINSHSHSYTSSLYLLLSNINLSMISLVLKYVIRSNEIYSSNA